MSSGIVMVTEDMQRIGETVTVQHPNILRVKSLCKQFCEL